MDLQLDETVKWYKQKTRIGVAARSKLTSCKTMEKVSRVFGSQYNATVQHDNPGGRATAEVDIIRVDEAQRIVGACYKIQAILFFEANTARVLDLLSPDHEGLTPYMEKFVQEVCPRFWQENRCCFD